MDEHHLNKYKFTKLINRTSVQVGEQGNHGIN